MDSVTLLLIVILAGLVGLGVLGYLSNRRETEEHQRRHP